MRTKSTLNPWVSIWTRPRATIQQIVDANPEHLVIMLAAISGLIRAANQFRAGGLGDPSEWLTKILIAAMVAPIIGIIMLFIGGGLIRWTGSWIGGNASSQNIRAAMAWSSVPMIWGLILWIPGLALFGQDFFATETPTVAANPLLAFIRIGFSMIEITIGLWAVVVFLKCLGQVQGFSAWKALGNMLLAGFFITIPISVLGILI
jgi:hypothetical protein